MSENYETKPGVKIPSREDSLPKRFYETVSVEPGEGGWAVLLDGRAVKTPARQSLALPTRAAAEIIAAEWAAQGERIDAPNMPATRLVFVALDHMEAAHDATAAEITKYASTDLLCFRAPEPADLIRAQASAWDPILGWAERELGIHLVASAGLMPVEQDAVALATVNARAAKLDDLRLTILAHNIGVRIRRFWVWPCWKARSTANRPLRCRPWMSTTRSASGARTMKPANALSG